LKVSVVIPVLNAAAFLPRLLGAIAGQKPSAPAEVILVDSSSTDNTAGVGHSFPGVKVIPIENFSHGRARNLGACAAAGDIIVLLTQDALPRDDNWLAGLLAPFDDERVGAVYSRQVPKEDAPPTEKYFLNYHFPPGNQVRREKKGAAPLSFKDVFFSNVSAAIRKDLLLKYPFDEKLIMSEDQQFARDILDAGFAIVYQPSSEVIHSHAYSLKTAFRRYFDSVYSLTVIFAGHDMGTSASIGLSYLRGEFAYIAGNYPLYLPYYLLYTIAKTGGTICGHFAERLPESVLKKISLHSYHWK
jgi:rhamnosyltransferase